MHICTGDVCTGDTIYLFSKEINSQINVFDVFWCLMAIALFFWNAKPILYSQTETFIYIYTL